MSSNNGRHPSLTLEIGGMMCQKNCATTVQKVIMGVGNVTDAVVTYSTNLALIWGENINETDIRNAIEDVGYEVVNSLTLTVPGSSSDKNTIQDTIVSPTKRRDAESSKTDINDNSLPIKVISARREVIFEVSGMSCANCALKIEKYLAKCPGVLESAVSCMTNKARVVLNEGAEGCVGPRDLSEHIQAMGYGCELSDPDTAESPDKGSNKELEGWKWLLIISVALGGPVTCLHLAMSASSSVMMMTEQPVACSGGMTLGQSIMMCLNGLILLSVGYRYYKGAILGALHGNFGMDCLVVTGTSITFIYSCVQLAMACQSGIPTTHVFFETTGMLLMFVTIGKFIEAYAKGKSASAVTNLLKLQPREALLVAQPASPSTVGSSKSKSSDVLQQAQESLKTIHVELVQRGDLLKVLPGDRIPTDGCVESGSSYVDESMITGESVAVLKKPGDLVFGCTVNQNNCIYIRVTSLGSESALAQIVRLVESAQMSKAPIQAFADRVAGIFTPIILCLACLTFVVWYSLTSSGVVPASWYREEYGDARLFSMLFAISVVVVSCPCALGLATPTAIMVGTTVGAANGILIKGGEAFEMAHKINTVVFDKTGTLTEGKPSVTDEILLVETNSTVLNDAMRGMSGVYRNAFGITLPPTTNDLLLFIAATAEQMSEHPLARALLLGARERGLLLEPLKEDAAVSQVGSGLTCATTMGTILVGNRAMMVSNGLQIASGVETCMWDLEIQGKTAVLVALNGSILGVLGIADVAKTEARGTIKALNNMGIDVWMLTGDSRTTAEAIAQQLGITTDRVVAKALPEDKLNRIKFLQESGRYVAMVGDGINDSPALAQSNLGVAIGTGTQVAIEAADMVLIGNHLHDLVVALDLAKVVFARINYNFIWAMIYNVIAIPYAAGCFFWYTHLLLPPQYAGLAMAMSSISVVMSSMALNFYQRPLILLRDDDTMAEPTILQKAARPLTTIKNGVKQMASRVSGWRRNSGVQYQQLARDEQEADQTLGLELGLGGLGGLVRNGSKGRGLANLEYADDVV